MFDAVSSSCTDELDGGFVDLESGEAFGPPDTGDESDDDDNSNDDDGDDEGEEDADSDTGMC